ncbi:MAG TPA: hypothetical protein DCS12_10670 [Clostridiales bacterium]|nr:hypothetical protein [Clostridiales bacterium]
MASYEKSLVEDYIIEKLTEKGWKFVEADKLERVNYDEPLLIAPLSRNIKSINKETVISDEDINKIINVLRLTGTGVEGAKSILNYYRFGIPIKPETEKTVKYIKLFDFQNIQNNEFIVSRQVYYHGREFIRTDIILYINGIPIVNIECKNPLILSESWYEAYRQINDYKKNVPELYKYLQLGIAADDDAYYFPITIWKDEVLINSWKHEKKNSMDSIVEMLSRDTLLDILQNYIFFRTEREESGKIICRYMQYSASDKIVKRVSGNLSGVEEKNKGLIWHWQGSGKTFTMIFAANKLYYLEKLENPTIFFIVDRVELERQLTDEFGFLDIGKPEVIDSVSTLKRVLKYDDYSGKRGLFITLIHKFKPEDFNTLQKELEAVSKNKESIMNRKNVIVFIDEGHRTQYGLLAAQVKSIFRNAFFFAFTGTPISKKEKDTYLEFSYPPEELYLDKYFIADSINDKFTVRIIYQPRLIEKAHLKKQLLESFLNSELEELPEKISEMVEESVKEKLDSIKVILESRKRISMIAKDIAEHFKENTDGKFKAIIVAASRIACNRYKEELDKYLPQKYSEIVMTYEGIYNKELAERVAEANIRFGTKSSGDINKEIIDKYKDEQYPKILIVTDMLLTGFNVPELQVMYLDKPLKEHRLLQAIARTNRPYKNIKEEGIIIDYVGVLKELKKAFSIYNEEDIKCSLFSLQNIEQEFIELINKILKIFEGLNKNYDRNTLLNTVELISIDKKNEREFIDDYKKLRKMFEMLGPKEIKVEYFKDYKWISAIYIYYMRTVNQKPPIDHYVEKYFERTIKFIHESTEIKELETSLPKICFDEKYFEEFDKKVTNQKEKAANLLFALNKMVLVERHKNPIYESLAERVERLLELWKEKTKDYKKIYAEGKEIISEIKKLGNRQKSADLSNLEYSLLLVLEEQFGKNDVFLKQIKNISKNIEKLLFPGWLNQPTEVKKIEREIRKFSLKIKKEYGLSMGKMNELFKMLMEKVTNYGIK